MRVRDLNGNSFNWKIEGNIVNGEDNRSRSELHIQARRIIKDLFSTVRVLEEVPIKPRFKTQFLDFYLPVNKLAIEVNGEQHYKFSQFYHSSASAFLEQKKRDRDKIDWCELNNITLVVLPYNESLEQWKNRILKRQTSD